MFNGSYFTSQGQPCGALLIDGVACGPLKNSAMRGMFVAEPRGVSPDLPRATILDLTATPVDIKKLTLVSGSDVISIAPGFQGGYSGEKFRPAVATNGHLH